MKLAFTQPPIFWRAVLIGFGLCGIWAMCIRISSGLGPATTLSDEFSWGLVAGLNVLCGLSIAAGGFTSAAAVRFLRVTELQPISRAAILIGVLGYLMALPALLFDLGEPGHTWRMMVGAWSTRHALSGAAWSLLLYAALLLAEFAPKHFARLRSWKDARWPRLVPPALLLAAMALSITHLYSLARIFLLAPGRRSPLWQTQFLPLLLLLAAMWGCLALLLFASWHTDRTLGKGIEPGLTERASEVLAKLLVVYLLVRLIELAQRDTLRLFLESTPESALLGVELSLTLLPSLLLLRAATRRDPDALYLCSALAVAAFMTGNLNLTITSIEAQLGVNYLPSGTEILFSYGLIAVGVALFYRAARHLPIFDVEPALR